MISNLNDHHKKWSRMRMPSQSLMSTSPVFRPWLSLRESSEVWCHDPNRQVAEGTEVYWKKKTEEKRGKGGAERET